MALIDRIDGLRCVDAGRLEMARIVGVADRAADLDQRAPQDARRDQDHRSLTPWSSSSPAGRAAPSSPAGCSTSSATSSWWWPTPPTTSRSTAPTSAPIPTCARSGWPTASTSAAGACAATPSTRWTQLRELGVDVWFNLGDRDLAIGLRRAQRLAEGATLTEAIGELTRGARAGRARAADGRPAGAHARAGARALGALPGVHDPRARRGPGRRRRARRASRRRARPRRSSTRSRARAPIVLGPSNPVISVRTILEVPGISEAVRAAAAPVVAVSPIVGGAGAQGPDRGLHGVGRPAGRARRGRRAPTTACSTAWWPTSPSTDLPALQTDTRMDDADARRRVAEDVLRFAEAL